MILHKGHHIERSLQLECSIELKGPIYRICTVEKESAKTNPDDGKKTRNRRSAVEDGRKKIKQLVRRQKR